MSDLTNYIFKNTAWLCTGLFLYYFLSAAKVYLLAYVQPLLFNNNEGPNLQTSYLFKAFLKTFFSNRALHQSTRVYLFGNKSKDTWKLVGNKKIKWRHDLLDSLTTLLKPFIIIAIAWAIIKFMLEKKLAYDELKITLGGIQQLIAYLKNLGIVKFIYEFKGFFTLTLVILFILLSVVRSLENRVKSFKGIVSFTLAIVSILGGLTFFGADLGAIAKNREKELRDLDLEISTIHENIYREVAEAIVIHDINEVVKEDVVNYEKEKKRMDSLFSTTPSLVSHPYAKKSLEKNLNELKKNFDDSTDFGSSNGIKVPIENKQVDTFIYSHFIRNYQQAVSVSEEVVRGDMPNAKDSYWENPASWNKERGKFYEEEAKLLKTEIINAAPEINPKISTVAKQIVDIFSKEIINKAFNLLNIEELAIPKAILSFISADKLKDCLAPRLARIMSSLGNTKIGIKKLLSPSCFKKEGSSEKRIKSIQIENEKKLQERIAGALKDQALAIEYDKQKAKELKIEEQRRTLIQTAENKINELVKNKIGVNEAIRNMEGFETAVNEIAREYKKQLKFDELDNKQLRRITRSNSLAIEIFKIAISSGSVVHPGPRATCPICNALMLL